ncbi:MAG: response regulator [Planctomycetes bacterium]|nr:response regulator [Planctomycetota bacterium]
MHQHVLTHVLKKCAPEVVTVGDGAAAVEACRGRLFSAVVLDCQLPVMDGFAAARAIRKLAAPHGAVPILGLSASMADDARERCREAGMNGFCKKPVEPGALLAMVAQIMGVRVNERHSEPARSAAKEPLSPTAATAPSAIHAETIGALLALSAKRGGSPSAAFGIVDTFLRDAPERMRRLAEARETRDLPLVSNIAHSLKSSSASLGALALSKLFAELEALGKTDAHDDAHLGDMFRAVESEWSRARAELEALRAGAVPTLAR